MTTFKVKILGKGNAGKRHAEILSNFGSSYQITDDYSEADIVSICTPHYQHFDQVYQALLNKKNVFVEKPLCESIQESQTIDDLADRMGVDVYPMLQYRYADNDPIAEAMIAEFPRDVKYWNNTWRGHWETGLGGVIQMHAVHILDLIKVTNGPPSAVHAQLWGTPDVEVETRAIINLQWSDGRSLSLGVAADDMLSENTEDHNWQWGASVPAYVKLFDAIHTDLTHPERSEDIRLPTIVDGIDCVNMITAIYASHLYGAWISLPMQMTTLDQGYRRIMRKFYPHDVEMASIEFH